MTRVAASVQIRGHGRPVFSRHGFSWISVQLLRIDTYSSTVHCSYTAAVRGSCTRNRTQRYTYTSAAAEAEQRAPTCASGECPPVTRRIVLREAAPKDETAKKKINKEQMRPPHPTVHARSRATCGSFNHDSSVNHTPPKSSAKLHITSHSLFTSDNHPP